MIWPLITGMLWQVMLIRMQRTTINPFLKMRAEASTSIQTRAEQLPTAEMYHRETSEFSVQDVKAFCKKHGITENVFFISAFGITLGKYNFRRMRYLPLFTTAETIPDFPIPLGMLVKTLPVYCDFSGSTADCLNAVQQQLINSMNNDIYPFSSDQPCVQHQGRCHGDLSGRQLRL